MFYVLGPLDEAAVGLDPVTLEKTSTPVQREAAAAEDPKAKGKAAPAKVVKEETRPTSGVSKVSEITKPAKYTKN